MSSLGLAGGGSILQAKPAILPPRAFQAFQAFSLRILPYGILQAKHSKHCWYIASQVCYIASQSIPSIHGIQSAHSSILPPLPPHPHLCQLIHRANIPNISCVQPRLIQGYYHQLFRNFGISPQIFFQVLCMFASTELESQSGC